MSNFFPHSHSKHVHPTSTMCIRTNSGHGEDTPTLTSSRPRTRISRSSKRRVLSKTKPRPTSSSSSRRPPSISEYVLDPANFFAIQRVPLQPSQPPVPMSTLVDPLDGIKYDTILASSMKSFSMTSSDTEEEVAEFDMMAAPPNTPLGDHGHSSLASASVAIIQSMSTSNGT